MSKNKKQIWQCAGRRLVMDQHTLIMGIINVTPDSFSDGGQFLVPEKAIERGLQMVQQGADILDIGGESSRPGAEPVPEQEELKRIIPVIEGLAKQSQVPLSVDTYKSAVAQAALDAGAVIVNDISGLAYDAEMIGVVQKYRAGLVLMHMRGTPRNMNQLADYQDLIQELNDFFARQLKLAATGGIDAEQIVFDPGIGFAKNPQDNFFLIRNLAKLQTAGRPLLLGPSRKSFIGKALHAGIEERLEGTAAAVAACILHGADIVRVHDVAVMKRVAIIADLIRGKTEFIEPAV